MKEAISSMFYIPYKKDVAKWYLEKQGKICRNRISSIQNNIKKKKQYMMANLKQRNLFQISSIKIAAFIMDVGIIIICKK